MAHKASLTDAERRQRRLESQRKWRAANREKANERNREYYAANREEMRQRRAANRERTREKNRQYREANREKINEQQRLRYQRNRSTRLQEARRYRQANLAAVKDRKRARIHGLSADQWERMWASQAGCCYLCRQLMERDEAVVEHWHGCAGPHRRDESCRQCHRGLAHSNCNSVVGLAGDDPDVLRTIADNLEAANAEVMARQTDMPQQLSLIKEPA